MDILISVLKAVYNNRMTVVAAKTRDSKIAFNFLKDEKLTDVCLSADGSLIRCHKIILAMSSKYFEVSNQKSTLIQFIKA